jgi:hypothetical protein
MSSADGAVACIAGPCRDEEMVPHRWRPGAERRAA